MFSDQFLQKKNNTTGSDPWTPKFKYAEHPYKTLTSPHGPMVTSNDLLDHFFITYDTISDSGNFLLRLCEKNIAWSRKITET